MILLSTAQILRSVKGLREKYAPVARAFLEEILYGGILAFAEASQKPCTQLEWDMKLWWPQCEAMIALRLASLVFGEKNYQNT